MESKRESLANWAAASREKPGFPGALRALLRYACADFLRKLHPETFKLGVDEAFLTVLRFCPLELAVWDRDPELHEAEILDFCANPPNFEIPLINNGGVCELDLRGVACPECSARARMLVASFPEGSTLEVLVDAGSPAENVPGALVADGNKIAGREKKGDFWAYQVIKERLVK